MASDKLAKLKSLLEKDRLSQDYKRERIVLELGESIVKRMEELGINRAELAKRLGVSSAMVTKMLRGNANFTLSTLVGLADALEQELSPIEFAPSGFQVRRFYVSTEHANAADYSKWVTRATTQSAHITLRKVHGRHEEMSTMGYKTRQAKKVSLAEPDNGKVA